MQRYTALFLGVLINVIFIDANAQSNIPKKINFDEGWRFSLGHASDPAKDFNYMVANLFSKSGKAEKTAVDNKFNDSSWRILNLPHDWAVELPFVNSPNFDVMSHGYKPVGGLFPETSVGWYRKHFTISKEDSGQRFSITFDGIFRDANIWLNGIFLGNNKSGYAGITYDITDYIYFEKENVLVVRADATQYEGWFYEGAGIYRHVWLNEGNNLHIAQDGLFVYADVKGNVATVSLEITVENKNLNAANLVVFAYCTDRNGRKISAVSERPLSLTLNGKATVKHTFKIINPRLWNLEDPYLYRVVSLVKQNGKVTDSTAAKFGVRTISFDAANGCFLNGRHIKIQGTNNHQDHAGLGSALPDYLQYYRIRLLKEMGSNAYRTSHHPPTPELLDACDSLGMLVLDENRLLNSSPEYMDQFERLIKRDRNHPSVFLWSIANEEGALQTNSTGKRIAQTLIAIQKQLDPTRTSTYAADLPNVFNGVNEVIPVRGFNYRQFGVADYHRDHPLQPIIGTEMGSTVSTRGIYQKDSVKGYLPDQDITAPWWASRAEEWWPLAAENSYWMGGFVWTGFDYRGEPTPFEWPNINSHFGVMDICGFPKNLYYYYQSWWTDKDVLHISPLWNMPAGKGGRKSKEGQPLEVWVNSNADNVELFLNGKSLGKKDMPRNSHLNWMVNYEPGKLEAVGYKGRRRLYSKLETTGEPYEVVVTPYKTTMLADGKDASVINISVVDKQGREVPTANNLITFKYSGDGKIIGVGNGDPSSHEPDKYLDDSNWQRSLFNGKCQVIMQAGTHNDIIKFEALSDGLQKGSTGIHTIQPSTPNFMAKNNSFKKRPVDKMLGADISFLPQMEARGIKFQDKGVEKDAIEILKDHGFNYVRLRIFHNPAGDSGYSPKKGFCNLDYTLQMAKRVQAAGMKLLLDFHYSDTWADPEKQFKPAAWKNLPFDVLKDSVFNYSKAVIKALKDQGTLPAMVQVGNEINHGMIWPEGHISHLDSLAALIDAGINGVHATDADIPIMLHAALGGQQDEALFFFDNLLARGLRFDVMGLSYYPKWHGTLDDLRNNLITMSQRYNQDIIVVEYSQLKREVNDIVFNLPGGKGKGTAIWEPLNTGEKIFEKDGNSNELILLYDEIHQQFIEKK